MNAQDKVKQQKVIQSVVSGIAGKVNDLVTEKNQFGQKIQDIIGGKALAQFSEESKQQEIVKLKQQQAGTLQAGYNDIVSRLEDLRKLMNERDGALDLQNPALTSALALINASGKTLPFETQAQINENFRYDQSSLKALRTAWLGVGATNGIDEMIYKDSDDGVINKLEALAQEALVQEGSLNQFAGGFAKVAAMEGVKADKTPDEVGFLQSMRRGAGLPD